MYKKTCNITTDYSKMLFWTLHDKLGFLFSPLFSNPTFFVIGVERGGTTSLWYLLKQHPEITLGIKKEIHYFDMNYSKKWGWYKSHFPSSFFLNIKLIGDVTPNYLFHPMVAKLISKKIPDAKFIILLRNPIQRAISHYFMNVRDGIEFRTIEQAFHEEKQTINVDSNLCLSYPYKIGYNHHHYSYLSRGVYINQINEFLNYFPLKNFQFILSQDFYEHPIAICNKIFNFLNVKNYSFLQPRHLNKGQYQYQIDQRLLDYLKCNFEKPNNELSKLLKLDLKFNEF